MSQQIKIMQTGMLIIGEDTVRKIFNEEEDYKRELEINNYCAKRGIMPKLTKVGGEIRRTKEMRAIGERAIEIIFEK